MAKRRPINIYDVARESHSSLTTVSLVLNNRDGRISEATRKRIRRAVNRLGYRPSRLALGLQSLRTGFLAILVPDLKHAFADAYFGELISAIHDSAREASCKVLLEVANTDFVRRKQHLELFDQNYIDGLLCMGVTNKDEYLADVEAAHRHALIVNNYIPGLSLNFVRCDYEQAGRLAAEHVLGLGHRHVALIHGAREVETTADFRRGIVQSLREHGRRLSAGRVEDGLFTEEGGAEAAYRLVQRDPKITAIITGNDKMAIGAISGLKAAGRRVPEDVSVVGCDDMHLAAFCDPPLTTVHTPIYEVGRLAFDRLMALIEGRVESVRETHPVTLKVRKSAAPPRR